MPSVNPHNARSPLHAVTIMNVSARAQQWLALCAYISLCCSVLLLLSCRPLNTPYPDESVDTNTLYSAFSSSPKHLDPARAYSSNEYQLIGQIYEPPLQYHYLKKPYTLIPLTATAVPERRKISFGGKLRDAYEIRIKPHIYYEPHPALNGKHELTAADYVYQIKRIAAPHIHSPIRPLMSSHIYGMKEFSKRIKTTTDLDNNEIEGVQLVDRYTYRIILNAPYPQFVHWLALPFFAPMPREVIHWYEHPDRGSKRHGIDWHPIGTGAYRMTRNDPNREIVLERNPNYRGYRHPVTGAQTPSIDTIVLKLEKENIPYWQKFLQGYYDASGIGSDQFDQAVHVTPQGSFTLTPAFQKIGVNLVTALNPSIFYMGFNMLDPTIGGYGERARLLRQAIAIAVDYEEMISIFANGRGIVAHSPIPPGIYGHSDGVENVNPVTHRIVDGRIARRPIHEARTLLERAGYTGGVDPKTGKPLVLHFDSYANSPDSRARLGWLRKQFAKLNIHMVVRTTDYNRFREKVLNGNVQIYEWGWNADYPDPENFFFLLYGPNSAAEYNGENSSNYANPTFDRKFEQMRRLSNSPQRLALIEELTNIVRHDVPWLWGWHPLNLSLYHQWVRNIHPNPMAHNNMQYWEIDGKLRAQRRSEWNSPALAPLIAVLLLLAATLAAAGRYYYKRQHRKAC